MGGKLFLHIGRNKAGSTTLQTAWLGALDLLRVHGIHYAMFGQPSPPGQALPSFASHMAMVAHVRDQPSAATLVSHEGLCCFPHDLTAAMASDIAALDVCLLFYVRPYRAWVVSDYIFNTMIGEQAGDFDTYLDDLGKRVRFWPTLAIWGDAIGWNRVRVRSLHADDLAGGELATDGLAALGIHRAVPRPVARENPSQPWLTAELMRFLLADPSDPRKPIERYPADDIARLVELVNPEVKAAAASVGVAVDGNTYLKPDQAARLRALYNEDLALLAARTGRLLTPDTGAEPVSSAAPSIFRLPPALRRELQARLEQNTVRDAVTGLIGDERLRAFLAL